MPSDQLRQEPVSNTRPDFFPVFKTDPDQIPARSPGSVADVHDRFIEVTARHRPAFGNRNERVSP